VVKGRNNYPCGRQKDITADRCVPSRSSPCTSDCPYKSAKETAMNNPIACLNYAYFLTEANHVGRFSGRQLLVCDEADVLEDEITNHISLSITSSQRSRYDLPEFPFKTIDSDHKIDAWKRWSEKSKSMVQNRVRSFAQHEHLSDSETEEKQKLESLASKFSSFNDLVDSSWLLDTNSYGIGSRYTFTPLWLTPDLTNRYLRSHCSSLLLMSATLFTPKILSIILGLNYSDINYITVPSTFPPENSPIHMKNIWDGRRATYTQGIDKAVAEVRKIIDSHLQDKGIIHCVSYKIMEAIVQGVGSPRFITHNSSNREAVLSRYLSSSQPLVLLSPSMERGVSLPGAACRFSILMKTPYPSLGDKKTSMRLHKTPKLGNLWYKSATAQTMIQCVGRCVRFHDDYATHYFLDKSSEEFIQRNPNLFTSHFLSCLKWD